MTTSMQTQTNQGNRPRKFWLEASKADPVTRQSYIREPLAGFTKTDRRAMVRQHTFNYLSRGLWVEVFDAETKELLDGMRKPPTGTGPGAIHMRKREAAVRRR